MRAAEFSADWKAPEGERCMRDEEGAVAAMWAAVCRSFLYVFFSVTDVMTLYLRKEQNEY